MTAGAMDTLTWRFLLAFTVFSIYILIVRKPIQFRWRTLIRFLPFAFCYPVAFFWFQIYGLLYVTSVEAGILTASAPILTAVLAAVTIKEKTNCKQYAAIGLSVAGVVYMTLMQGGADAYSGGMFGYALIFLSCCANAGYAVINRVSIRSFSVTEITFYLMLIGVLFFTPISLVFHIAGGTIGQFFVLLCNGYFIAAVLFLGLLSSLLTTILTSVILKRFTSAQFVVFLNLSTVIAVAAGWLFLHEHIHAHHLIGTVMILLGVAGTSYFQQK